MDLGTREKKIIAVCVAIVLAAVLHIAVIVPSLEKRDELRRSIRKAELQREELRVLGREYDQILRETKNISQRTGGQPRGFELLPFLTQTANRLKLKSHLTSMKPSQRQLGGNLSESMVDLRLEGVSLENLVDSISAIEQAKAAVAISSIRVQPESKLGGGLNVSMRVISINPR